MAETMVERVGLAARKAAGRYSLSAQSGVPNAQVSLDGKLIFSGPLAECHALISSAVGRAAIEDMREPTERMGMEGLRAWDPDARGSVSDHLAANPSLWMRPTWQAMIDAILKEEGNG